MNNITVKSVRAYGGRLTIDFRCRGQISKFFQTNQFYADYNTAIEAVPEEILIIPFLAAVLPIVWANHAEIYVDAVDEIFLESMKTYKKALQKMYPKLSLSGRLITKHTAKQHLSFQSKNMMLFSGGVDSLATYIRHKNEDLTLVCFQGADVKPDNTAAWQALLTLITEFSNKNGSPLRTISSNFVSMVDLLFLRIYDDYIYEKNGWFTHIMFGLAFLGLCAPLAYAEKIEKFYFASDMTITLPISRARFLGAGSHPTLINNVRWAGTSAILDGYLSKVEKMLVISEYVKNIDDQLFIRSCNSPDARKLNCVKCEKCSRTILGLELAGLDPNKHGFNLDADTFSSIKNSLINGDWKFGEDERCMWGDLKSHYYLKDNIIHSDAKLLIDWLKYHDLNTIISSDQKYDYEKQLIPFFRVMPNFVYQIVKTCYYTARGSFRKRLKHVLRASE